MDGIWALPISGLCLFSLGCKTFLFLGFWLSYSKDAPGGGIGAWIISFCSCSCWGLICIWSKSNISSKLRVCIPVFISLSFSPIIWLKWSRWTGGAVEPMYESCCNLFLSIKGSSSSKSLVSMLLMPGLDWANLYFKFSIMTFIRPVSASVSRISSSKASSLDKDRAVVVSSTRFSYLSDNFCSNASIFCRRSSATLPSVAVSSLSWPVVSALITYLSPSSTRSSELAYSDLSYTSRLSRILEAGPTGPWEEG